MAIELTDEQVIVVARGWGPGGYIDITMPVARSSKNEIDEFREVVDAVVRGLETLGYRLVKD